MDRNREPGGARRIALFVVCVLGAAAVSLIKPKTPFLSSLVFCLEHTVYVGLVLFWIQSLHRRLLPSPTRRYMLAGALFMLLFLLLRAYKYRVPLPNTAQERMFWYLFYVPLLFIPTLFCTGCLSFSLRRPPRGLSCLLIPAAVLSAIVLTNEASRLVFVPLPGFENAFGLVGTYRYTALFYVCYGWIGLMMLGGVASLLSALRRPGLWRRAIWPLLFVLLWLALILVLRYLDVHGLPHPISFPTVNCFCLLGMCEACIRTRLMPCNTDYRGFFSHMTAPAVITDRDLRAVYRAAAPVEAAPGDLRASLAAPVYTDPDTRLSGMALRAGYVFWTEDESGLNRMIRRLEEANEALSQENELISAENELRERKAHVESRSRIYRRIAEELAPVQRRIRELLDSAEPGTPGFRPMAARVAVLNAFVKRKSNLLLLAADGADVEARELALALEESARYLRYCGVDASVHTTAAAPLSGDEAVRLYDAFLALTDALEGRITLLMISLSDSGLRLTADCAAPLPPTKPWAETRQEEGLLYLTVIRKEAAG